jgi:hypothetical protein
MKELSYNFFLDCMPVEQLPTILPEQMGRILTKALSTKRLSSEQVRGSHLALRPRSLILFNLGLWVLCVAAQYGSKRGNARAHKRHRGCDDMERRMCDGVFDRATSLV